MFELYREHKERDMYLMVVVVASSKVFPVKCKNHVVNCFV